MNSWGSACMCGHYPHSISHSPAVQNKNSLHLSDGERQVRLHPGVEEGALGNAVHYQAPGSPPHMWLTICLLAPCKEVEMGLALHWGGYRELLVSLSKLSCSGYPKKFNRQVT